jgi:two-component system OmpR family sensor kinase
MTARLIAVLTISVAVLWCLAALISGAVFSGELDETFDSALQETAQRLLPLAADDVDEHDDEERTLRDTAGAHDEYISYQVFDRRNRLLLRSHDAPAEPFTVDLSEGFHTAGGLRIYVEREGEYGIAIAVAEELEHRREAVWESTLALFMPLAALVPLSAVVIWLAVRGAMRPVNRLGDQIAARGRDNLSPIETGGLPSELEPIARAVVKLMGRLRTALDAERAFAANSAHELRTPIAAALAQTQRLISELRKDDSTSRARATQIETALKRLANLSEKLMQLSRADAGIAFGTPRQDLLPVLDLVVGECRQRRETDDRVVYVREADDLVAGMDADAFAIAVRNLIDNALAHGDADRPIEIVAGADGTVRVVNAGAIVPPEKLPELMKRFARGDTEAIGSGLGLSIVETIARQSGGSLALRSPASGRADGFEAVLRLPDVG